MAIASLDTKYGGPSHSVPALAEALSRSGVRIELLACEPGAGASASRSDQARVSTTLLPSANRSTRWRERRNDFFSTLRARCAAFPDTIFHDNGLWLPNNHAVAAAARELRRPLVISPRGMLSTWAIQFKGWKKNLAWWLYQRRDLQSATVLHATSEAEAGEFRALGLRQPIGVIPNGVELPPVQKPEVRNQKSQACTLLFLGRIHPVKGLMDLVQAWAVLRGGEGGKPKEESEREGQWRVVIAGNDEAGHLNRVKEECRRQKVEQDFEFVGPVEGAAKWKLYRSADLFVLPSHSENFGIVVAEALACGVPVITTRGTPWGDLVAHRCGWWTEIGPEPLTAALSEAMTLTAEARREMGERGRRLVESKYSWDAAAEKMLATYRWMLGRGERPVCVIESGAIE